VVYLRAKARERKREGERKEMGEGGKVESASA